MTTSYVETTAPAQTEAAPSVTPVREGIVERTCGLLCELALVAMVLLIFAEIVARVFNHSFQVADELGGYLLSALTFLSLPVALVGGAYHQVDYFSAKLSPRARAVMTLIFTLLSLLFALVVEWQLWRLVSRSYSSDVTAPTLLGTPMWIPQGFMLLGCGALIWSLCRVLLANIGALRAGPKGER